MLHCTCFRTCTVNAIVVFASTRKVTPSYWLYTSNKGDPKNSKVTAGHVVMFAGGPISWQCKQALHVGASPSHNEYMEAFHAAKEAKWLRDLLIELDIKEFPSDVPVVLETMTSDQLDHSRNGDYWKQSGVCTRRIVDPRRVDTVLNTADVFTKSLASPDIDRLRPLTGMASYHQFLIAACLT